MKKFISIKSVIAICSLVSSVAMAQAVPWVKTSVTVGELTAELSVYSSEEVPSVCAVLNLVKDQKVIDSKGLCQLVYDGTKTIDLASEVSDFSISAPVAGENTISYQVEFSNRVGIGLTNLDCVIEVSEKGASLPICKSI